MQKKRSWSGLMLMGLVAVGLLAWAAPAAAAGSGGDDRSDRSNLSFLFDKDAFGIMGSQAGGGGSQGSSKLSIRLYGGYGHIAAGDVNDGADYYFEILEIYSAQGFGTVTGGYKPLHGGYDFGADLIYQITPRIGLGLGAGFMRNSSHSLGNWTYVDDDVDITVDSTLSAIPIRLGVFFTVPVGGRLNLTADVGAAYYLGLKLDATQRLDFADASWMEMSVGSTEAGSSNIGFHGSLGFEYKLSQMMGLFVEAAGRYAKLSNFDAVTGIQNSSGGGGDTTDGKLYIATQTDPDFPVSGFTIEETPPVDDEFTTYREPKVDLSGFSLRAGIRIRF